METTEPIRTVGQYERFFQQHNKRMNYLMDYKTYAIPFHIAVQLVEEGIWERKKHEFVVVWKN